MNGLALSPQFQLKFNMLIPRARCKWWLVIISVFITLVCVRIYDQLRIPQPGELYFVETLPGTAETPIPSWRKERQAIDNKYEASRLLYETLLQTANERISLNTLIQELRHSKIDHYEGRYIGYFQYIVQNKSLVDDMLKAAELLLDQDENISHKMFQVHYLYNQLKILHLRVFPKAPRPQRCNGCMKYNFSNLIRPRSVCKAKGNIVFVSLVTSVPKNVKERDAVRKTWGSFSKGNTGPIRNLFLFGGGWSAEEDTILQREALLHGDILQDDFKDGYYNLTYKMLMGFRWAVDNCPRALYVMRAADDAYVHVERVLQLIKDHSNDDAFRLNQVGLCFKYYQPHRYMDYKGYVSKLEYPRNLFPPYALGTNFLTSMKLTRDIIKASVNVPFFSIEDAYFGFVLFAMERGCYNIPNFVNHISGHFLKHFYFVLCNRAHFYSQHTLSPELMHKIHRNCDFFDSNLYLAIIYVVLVTFIVCIYIKKCRML